MIVDLPAVDLHLKKIRVQPPIGNVVEVLIPALRGLHRAVDASSAANFDHALKTLQWMALGAQELLEETDPAEAHSTLQYSPPCRALPATSGGTSIG
jgi:hypothetical protein